MQEFVKSLLQYHPVYWLEYDVWETNSICLLEAKTVRNIGG